MKNNGWVWILVAVAAVLIIGAQCADKSDRKKPSHNSYPKNRGRAEMTEKNRNNPEEAFEYYKNIYNNSRSEYLDCPACEGNTMCRLCSGKGKINRMQYRMFLDTINPNRANNYPGHANTVSDDTCPECGGSGYSSMTCSWCGGSGVDSNVENFKKEGSPTAMMYDSQCPKCGGKGQERCGLCHGSGRH